MKTRVARPRIGLSFVKVKVTVDLRARVMERLDFFHALERRDAMADGRSLRLVSMSALVEKAIEEFLDARGI